LTSGTVTVQTATIESLSADVAVTVAVPTLSPSTVMVEVPSAVTAGSLSEAISPLSIVQAISLSVAWSGPSFAEMVPVSLTLTRTFCGRVSNYLT